MKVKVKKVNNTKPPVPIVIAGDPIRNAGDPIRITGDPIRIAGEFIKLESLLKYAALVGTGGEAKLLIQDGRVLVNGETCTQRGRKVRPGDTVSLEDKTLKVLSAGQAAP